MIGVWRGPIRLLTTPRETLEGLLARRILAGSVALGAAGYYWRTLQVSELLFAPALGGIVSFVLNGLVAVGWMALLVFLIHLACRLVGHRQGRWRDLFLLWGYTQVPAIILAVLAMAVIGFLPPTWRFDLDITWVALGVTIVLLLSLWGLILKFQAIKVCYDLSGGRLFQVIVLALVLFGVVAWAEHTFVADRGLVPGRALRAMAPTVGPFTMSWRSVNLPFDKLTYHLRHPRRGEIVGFIPPGSREFPWELLRARVRFLGRVVGMPGDEVEVRQGQVHLGGRRFDEPYHVGGIDRNVPPTKVPPGYYFILGDNRDVPLAEYHGGLVSEERLRGRMTDVGRVKWEFLVGKGRW